MGVQAEYAEGLICSLEAFVYPTERVREIQRVETLAVTRQIGNLPHPRYYGMTKPGPSCRRNQSGDLG
jgi:hypothetical protein